MASITKRKDSYLIRVSCGYGVDGNKITQSTTWHPNSKKSDKQNQKELHRFALEFDEKCKGIHKSNRIKFEAFAEEWFKNYAEIKLKEKTLARYRQLKERTYKAIGHLWIDKITTRNIQNFVNDLNKDGVNQRTGGKLSPKIIKHYVDFLSSIFSYAIKMQMVKENPCKNVTQSRDSKEGIDCYSLEEMREFLSLLHTAPIKYHAFFTLAIYSGCREGEMLGLEWKDIDFDTNVICIKRNALYTPNKGYYTDTPKTKKSVRSIKLPAEAMNVLKLHRQAQLEQKNEAGDKW